MPFPTSHAGSLDADLPNASEDDAARLRGRIADWLTAKNARQLRRTASGIIFAGGGPRSLVVVNPVTAVSAGTIDVVHDDDSLRIDYSVDFSRSLARTTILTVFGGGLALVAAPEVGAVHIVILFAIIWVLLTGITYGLAVWALRRALASLASEARSSSEPQAG
jgi:type IV secretory pathway TrbD component